MKLKDTHGDELFYFKLFVDFKAIVDRMWQPYSAIYGNKNESEVNDDDKAGSNK